MQANRFCKVQGFQNSKRNPASYIKFYYSTVSHRNFFSMTLWQYFIMQHFVPPDMNFQCFYKMILTNLNWILPVSISRMKERKKKWRLSLSREVGLYPMVEYTRKIAITNIEKQSSEHLLTWLKWMNLVLLIIAIRNITLN